ncbi:MAG: RlmE family RNA methyltransferase [Phycisphaerales bacterium]|nr:RlmE family RNA methyltransferase [Phycisphaerales bacterium]
MPQPRKLHDRFFKQAKAEGYVARSAYKLIEINDRRKLINPGNAVLDLGCAPGSWLQVVAPIIGPRGIAVGIDLQPVTHSFPENVRTIVADVFKVDPKALLDLSGRAFDLVLSDMAPNTSGHGDDLLSARLCRRVLEILPPLLRRGGNLAMKVFEGSEYPALLKDTQSLFREVKGLKPEATRDVSREIYIVAKGYKPA